MKELLNYIVLHPVAGIAIALLLVLTVFVWIKAIKSGKERNFRREKIIADIEKEKKLRNDYRTLSLELILNETDKYRAIQGVCANIQMSIEKKEDINSAFNSLPECKKYVYCLGYVFEDSKNKLSEFFRINGEPLISVSRDAVISVIGGEFSKIFLSEFDMFDEDNESASVDKNLIEKTDNEFKNYMSENCESVYGKCVDYIKSNISELTKSNV